MASATLEKLTRGWLFACCLASLAGCHGNATSYRVVLHAEQRDYRLPSPPAPGSCRIDVSGFARAAPKNKLVFDRPLAPGAYALALSATAAPSDMTVVLSVPLEGGSYEFSVTTSGAARFDLAFHDSGPQREYRYTLTQPEVGKVLRLEMPARMLRPS
jgi:hypothetical protein